MTLADYIAQHTTVTSFAAKLGRSRAQVHRYIRGENLSKGIIEDICRASDNLVKPADFFAAVATEEVVAEEKAA